MRSLILALNVLLVACNGSSPDTGDTADTDTDTDTGADTDTDVDTDVEESCTPDEDGDGYCPPEDCDDTTILVSPAWDEDPADDIDNNCDGRIDEVFAAVYVNDLDRASGVSAVRGVDPLGDSKGAFPLSEPVLLTYATDDTDLRHWVGWSPSVNGIVRYDETGDAEIVAALPEEYDWDPDGEDGEAEADPPPIIGDMAAHPDGYYLVVMGDRLVRFNEDGSWAIAAQWACVEEDESHEMCATAIGVDPIHGDVRMFGYFGGQATWSEADGITIEIASDPEEPGPQLLQSQFKVFETWYALGLGPDPETGDPNYVMYRFNRETGELVALNGWPDADFAPQSFSIEAETGDFYLAANSPSTAEGGSFNNMIWRWATDGRTGVLYDTGMVNPADSYTAATIYYEQD